MSVGTSIEWTDATWNPVVGCEPVSPGCLNCYAASMARRLEGMGRDGYTPICVQGRPLERIVRTVNGRAVFTGSVRFREEVLSEPHRWRRPRRVFVCSMSDLFHEGVTDAQIEAVFEAMSATPQHTYQVLTKRPERMAMFLRGWIPAGNIWLGTSCEDQQRFDERVRHLLNCRGSVRFLSCEPLLEPIDFRQLPSDPERRICWGRIDWVIVGGESGPRARPCQLEWIRSIVHQCQAAGVPCFVKQLGAVQLMPSADPSQSFATVKLNRSRLKDPKGGDPDEWPADLRVRAMPMVDRIAAAPTAQHS